MNKIFYTLAILLSNYLLVKGQQSFRPDQPFCGIKDLTSAQANALKQQAILALKRKMATQTAFTTITYVPIRPHIIRRSNGTDGYTLTSINQVLAATNRYYLLNNIGIQFYFAGTTPDYVDDDGLYNSFPFGEGPLVDSHDSHQAMNQYYVNNIQGGYGGYAYYPANNLQSTRSFIQTYAQSASDTIVGNYTIPHELGHNFGLFHTLGPSNGTVITDELVTRGPGANCEIAGDLICDTPADPYGMAGISVSYVNGCPRYNPTSTARDANGDLFDPMTTNAMSYYVSMTCTHDFTQGQAERMQAALALRQSHTAYTLDFPATNVVPASNLTATSTGVAVVITWQDNADNEMGYFIERSTSPTTDFVPIGGTATNETRFVDTKVTAQTQYYYRIRPSNSTTGSISSITSVLTLPVPPVTGLITTDITQTSAQLVWNSLGEGAQYQLQWRPVGVANWTSDNTPTEPFYLLNQLSMDTEYEWQVRAAGNDTYSGPVRFRTGIQCQLQVPYNQSVSPMVTSAVLSWEQVGLNTSYDLRYRTTGTNDWINVNHLTSTSVNITALTGSSTYEWQVRTVCDNGGATSDFSSLYTFTTFSCAPPSSFQVTNVTTSSAQLSWSYWAANTETSYQVRYRIWGTTNWTVVNNLPAATIGSPLTLTGLTSNTIYEWQVRTLCSATETSDFSSSLNTFQTLPIEPDLTPIMYVRPSPSYGNSSISVVLDLVELNSRPTSGLVTVKITKDSRVGLNFDTGLTSLGGRSVQNGVWSFVSSDASYYVLTTTQRIEPGDKLSLGLSGSLSPGATTGALTISATVLGSNSVDSKPTNNIDADKVDYFQQ
ncbi:fibronectin type III domain-containing protein [Spirosoma validum]|uniref:Fibronectin type III domain-containing protein n=1 Tax=Spirosoma validum TaxID=2771355 RepID=A0A927B4X2_9BACT|nr:fibronectin type III domain-containing protein [Spirosoma validum]MBD2755459.1 fibronectin type III domain-containing protein [Spirosoma validum]